MGWIDSIHCEKFRCDFVERTFALIAPVQPVLYRASCRYWNNPKCTQTLRNAPKHEYRVQWVDRVRSLRKILMRLRGTNFRINYTSSTRFALSLCSNETSPNALQHYETHQNMSLGSNGVDRVRSLWKIPKRFHGTNSCINCTKSTRFPPSFV